MFLILMLLHITGVEFFEMLVESMHSQVGPLRQACALYRGNLAMEASVETWQRDELQRHSKRIVVDLEFYFAFFCWDIVRHPPHR